ncbi:MAG TPA: hypothetical protein VFB62_14405 [Polyangiaceae bacterium]|nr:hypothetical protein [Polyangiaceae bacterium]
MKRLAVLLALLSFSAVSRADDRCTPSFERAQELRAKSQLMAAREELLVCAAQCGEELRRYCVTWLTEVEAELASVVLVARRGGKDVPLGEVRIYVDGAERQPQRGRLVLEPGTHTIAFVHRGDTVEQRVTLQAGGEPTSIVATFSVPKPQRVEPRAEPTHETPIASWVLIGLGGAALTAAAILTINGHLMRGDLKDSCAPACEPDSIVPIERQWIAAGVLAGAGAVALISAGVIAAVDGDAATGGVQVRARF